MVLAALFWDFWFRVTGRAVPQPSGTRGAGKAISEVSDSKHVRRTCKGSGQPLGAESQRPEPPPTARPLPSPAVSTPTSTPLPLATSPLWSRPTRQPRLVGSQERGGGAQAMPLQRTKTCASPFLRVGGRFFAEGRIGGL